MQCFNIWTSTSGPNVQCFLHLDLEMCFSPQRRVTFEHLRFKKVVETISFWAFLLGNVLLATAACNASTSSFQKAPRVREFFKILPWKCAPRQSDVQRFNIVISKSVPKPWVFLTFCPWIFYCRQSNVQFLISSLTTCLRTRRFTKPIFRLTRHKKPWKKTQRFVSRCLQYLARVYFFSNICIIIFFFSLSSFYL